MNKDHVRRIRRSLVGLGAVALTLAACERAKPPAAPTAGLAWAYPRGADSVFGKPLGPGPFHVPGGALTLTRAQMEAAVEPVDWRPDEHPPAPAIIRGPTASKVTPCAECHGFNGAGYPGSADLAGLPAAYIIEQVQAFRSGERRSADPEQPSTAEMIAVAKGVRSEELAQAAAYFAQLPRPHPVRVLETDAAPRTVPDKYGWLDPAPGGGTDPIGDRVVELSDNLPLSLLGDDHVTLTDYAPPGAVARGRAAVESGGGGGAPCKTCHGPQFRGGSLAPPLAGRPAAYLARTLWDIRVGARRGPSVSLMQGPAKGLSPAQIRDISAYLASLPS